MLLDLLVFPHGVTSGRPSSARTGSPDLSTSLLAGGEGGVSRKSGGGVGWIIGVVRDTNNQLLDNMFVETSGSLDVTQGGQFRLAVADGQYSVKCFGSGHQTMAFPNAVDVPTATEVEMNFTLTPSQSAVAFRALNEYYQPGDHPTVTINFSGQGDAVSYVAVFPPDISGNFFCLDGKGKPGGDNLPLPRTKITLTPDYKGSDTLALSVDDPGRYTLYTVITRPGANVADFSTWLGYDQATFIVE
ncbi:MAG: hypothetical protein HQK58_17710 [Deltaproteobacteria bacterium]|nr:hypothetical protein [Deltaproteobacteria bacterium]